ncbi:MAG: hypothetical protein ACOC0C_08345 [Bacteroidota bacterium]
MILKQDLHIHTIFSVGDSAVVEQQTPELIASVRHAEIIGISDHFESFRTHGYPNYKKAVCKYGLKLGTEVDGYRSVHEASELAFDYYIYHCHDEANDYLGIEVLLQTGKPVILAHPYVYNTDLERIPEACFVEINNRYIWRYNWREYLTPFLNKFQWVLSSDAHQPNWLNQNVARYVAQELGINESMVFSTETSTLCAEAH